VNQFLWGALSALSIVASAFFWRFWRRTRDELFAAFAAAFAILAVHWTALGLMNPDVETLPYLYLPRFAAFGLIIWGVIRKNRPASRTRGQR
jgi:hypothetical protein